MQNPSSSKDTIAAIATAAGQGGIGIVRLSGPASRDILHALFEAGRDAFSFMPRVMHHGWVHDAAGERLDEVLAVWMPGPGTATGEDTGEIHCHGGPAILAAVLEAALDAGARMAGPGEFTYRAFMNGKYDLTQAEAVAEMIAAPSRQGLRLARAKLEGVMGARVASLRDLVDEMRARMTLSIDFVEDDVDDFDSAGFRELLSRLLAELRALLAGYGRAKLWREGVLTVLAGQVNVGKSSLLNALLGRNRAIVSDTPGTTRDFIEETIDLDGLPLRLVDTAGLREGEDAVEEEGVRLSRQLTRDADILLLVLTAGQPVSSDERELLFHNPEKTLVVVNKIDTVHDREKALTGPGFALPAPPVTVSAKTGEGLEELAGRIRSFALARSGGQAEAGDLAPNLRQSTLLKNAKEEAEALLADFDARTPHDLLAVRLDALAATLDEVSGHAAPDDILSRIFSRFCIGK